MMNDDDDYDDDDDVELLSMIHSVNLILYGNDNIFALI